MEKESSVVKTELPVKLFKRGKVRDIYDLGEYLLLVATDRISAFDVVLPTPIPGKGKLLTMMSCFWFDFFSEDVLNHLVSRYASNVVWRFPELKPFEDQLVNRIMLVKKCKVIPIECIVRGYITGSGWRSYLKNGEISGVKLPKGLQESQELPEPIFTPTTKADSGHDEQIVFDDVKNMLGIELAEKIRQISIFLYSKAKDFAYSRGIIIADTKFEFGLDENGNLCLIDEVLTPDSSRFWRKDSYRVGISQKSFDKQFVRDYLASLDWDKNPPGPNLPRDIVEKSYKRYSEIFHWLVGI